jgi:hypothetical protein
LSPFDSVLQPCPEGQFASDVQAPPPPTDVFPAVVHGPDPHCASNVHVVPETAHVPFASGDFPGDRSPTVPLHEAPPPENVSEVPESVPE